MVKKRTMAKVPIIEPGVFGLKGINVSIDIQRK
jgi:hypothetical protein